MQNQLITLQLEQNFAVAESCMILELFMIVERGAAPELKSVEFTFYTRRVGEIFDVHGPILFSIK